MNRTVLFLCGLFLCSFLAFGASVSEEEALDIALSFMRSANKETMPVSPVSPVDKLTKSVSENTPYYMFNVGDNNGFVIVSGNDIAQPILGFSEKGCIDPGNLPENMSAWLDEYAEQMSFATEGSQADNSRILADIEPLIQTEWNQDYPYNRVLPNVYPTEFGYDNDYKTRKRLATGCVATAMAQVMFYHKYPEIGKHDKTYSVYYKFSDDGSYKSVMFIPLPGYNHVVSHAADFGNTYYDWDNMQLTYSSSIDKDAAQTFAVSTLIYHCGIAVDMNYGTLSGGGSSALSTVIPYALEYYFDYDSDVRLIEKMFYSDSDWEETVYDELSAGRPVIYNGNKTLSQGHTFVCDGFKYTPDNGNFFHFNWGWGGYCDGYFKFSALKPSSTDYTNMQSAVIGIMPKTDPVTPSESCQIGDDGCNSVIYTISGENVECIDRPGLYITEEGRIILNF